MTKPKSNCRHCSEDKGHGVATAINPFSGRCEICHEQVRPDPRSYHMVDAMRYMFMSRPKKLTWWQRVIKWFKKSFVYLSRR